MLSLSLASAIPTEAGVAPVKGAAAKSRFNLLSKGTTLAGAVPLANSLAPSSVPLKWVGLDTPQRIPISWLKSLVTSTILASISTCLTGISNCFISSLTSSILVPVS
ncbi:Uncharacterised protein [Legionella pneumophila]|nr:Uncharacterised protein [Legionella pneumophila]